jgi:hypothetical protein|tara:strand:+ start:948 stop:1529 length:582 start_codon:yes stop_codon:yes gene_type:complete
MNYRIPVLIVSLALVAGCSSVHTIDAQFPIPLVEPLPKSAFLSMPEEFQIYQFVQDEEDRADITIILGQAHSNLFNSVVSALFTNLTDAPETADITLMPELNAFQYALPKETGSNFFEVWMKYRLQATDAEGEEIADWLITGYGRATDERFQSTGTGINGAAEEALRDIGTQLTLGFAQQEDIENWINSEVQQ